MTNSNEKTVRRLIRKRKPVSVRSHRYGTIHVRRLTFDDVVFVEALFDENLPARDFTVRLIQHQLADPSDAVQGVVHWNDRLLLRVANAWIKHEKLDQTPTSPVKKFDEFKQIIVDYVARQHRQMQAAMESIQKSYREAIEPGLAAAAVSASRMSDLMASSLDALYRDNLNFSGQINQAFALDSVSAIGKVMAKLATDRAQMMEVESMLTRISAEVVTPWLRETRQARQVMVDSLAAVTPRIMFTHDVDLLSQNLQRQVLPTNAFQHAATIALQLAESANWAKMSHITVLAEKSLLNVQPRNIASLLNIEQKLRESVASSFVQFSTSFADLYRPPAEVVGVQARSLELFRLPPIEYFTGARVLESISIDEGIRDVTSLEQRTRDEIVSETEDSLPALLANLDPSLVQLWQGAKQALNSDNPDRVRHFAISVRELMTQVLHLLAPDDQIRAWSNSPVHFYQNRPTRRARLQFIYRGITNDKFGTFVESDISTSLALLDLFQTGTHGVVVEYTRPQLEAMGLKMDAVIRFILEISAGNK